MKTNAKPWAKAGAAAIVLAAAGALGAYFESAPHQPPPTVAYQDVGGTWTICRGHTVGVHKGDTATLAQCEHYLKTEMADAYSDVQRCIHVPLTIGQQAAFTDAVYNLGPRIVCSSTLQKMANSGDLTGACNQLSRWVYVAGKPDPVPGLVKRRAAERDLCINGLQ